MNKQFRDRKLFLSNNTKLKSLDEYYHDVYNYFNLHKIIDDNNAKLKYIETKSNKIIFKAIGCKPEFLINVYFYNNGKHKSADIKFSQILSQYRIEKTTSHILLPYTVFITEINYFMKLIKKNIVNKKDIQYNKIIKNYNNNKYGNIVTILISETATGESLLNFIKNNCETLSIRTWKILFFQVISTLAVIQSKLPSFLHNDFSADNILLTKIKRKKNRKYMYVINKNKYIVPIIKYQIKLWNFELSTMPTKNNYSYNKYYDLHYFVNTLMNEYKYVQYMPLKVVEFLTRIVPNKYRTGNKVSLSGHIINNIEYTTPNKVLMEDCFFDEFKYANCVKKKIERKKKENTQIQHRNT